MAYCTEYLTKEDAEGALRGIDNSGRVLILIALWVSAVIFTGANNLWLVLLYIAAWIIVQVQRDCRAKLKDYIKKQAV